MIGFKDDAAGGYPARVAVPWCITPDRGTPALNTLNSIARPSPSDQAIDESGRYGITRTPVDYFHFGEFRYTSLADALAEAERQWERDRIALRSEAVGP
jgi:hypothetical protein